MWPRWLSTQTLLHALRRKQYRVRAGRRIPQRRRPGEHGLTQPLGWTRSSRTSRSRRCFRWACWSSSRSSSGRRRQLGARCSRTWWPRCVTPPIASVAASGPVRPCRGDIPDADDLERRADQLSGHEPAPAGASGGPPHRRSAANPGRLIWAAERSLQLLADETVLPTRFSLLATPATRAMTESAFNRLEFNRLELDPWVEPDRRGLDRRGVPSPSR